MKNFDHQSSYNKNIHEKTLVDKKCITKMLQGQTTDYPDTEMSMTSQNKIRREFSRPNLF
jgi:hypothetical protein